MADPSFYDVLGVPANASQEEISAAYMRLVNTVHPAVGGNAALFEYVQAAWEALGDPDKRRAHDEARAGTPAVIAVARTGAVPPDTQPTARAQRRRRTGLLLGSVLAVAVVGGVGAVLILADGPDEAPVPVRAASSDTASTAPAATPAPPRPPLVTSSPRPTGPDPGEVSLGEIQAESACGFALGILPIELGDVTSESKLGLAADRAVYASLNDPKWRPLREQTRIAKGAYVAASRGDSEDASEDLLDAMQRIDSICQ